MQSFRERSIEDLARKDIPKFLSLKSRMSMKCDRIEINDSENCQKCDSLVLGAEPAVPQEILHLHNNVPRFWGDS